ncbi:Tautomerase/MIF [Dendrothele bispora CBS 962.96]|uniref:L-dopachrome isomerase n=1 Tax=Dendrothele bispora (strain CBS 962.96) TaxID=1314807 RepID=A0A4S8M2L4_DENBC|nr:Tautomerase/MIF [Dendrothele bispora CBS 962.96]
MPALELKTNVKIPNLQEYMKEFSKFSANALGKPEEYICVLVLQDQPMTFRGSTEPAFFLNITSLGNINPDANIGYSAAFFEYFKKTLGVDGDRGYISFIDPGTENLGYKGTTFSALWANK